MSSYGTNATENVSTQYSTAKNLNSRIELHKRFSANKYGWSRWVFDRLDFAGKSRVLELGCGNGDLWKSNIDRKPAGLHAVLSDFSSGMAEAAALNLKEVSEGFEFRVIDAQSIPYEDKSFDIVIANHMLYHVPDRKKALSEIHRVLKEDGAFYATTIGAGHMKELVALVHGFDKKICYPADAPAYDFGLENGAEQLKGLFDGISVLRYEDSLDVTEAGMLADYVLSSQGFGNVTDILTPDREKDFKEYISALMEKNGSIRIMKDSGIIIARRPGSR